MKQAKYGLIADSKRNIIYPIYSDRNICSKVVAQLGSDIDILVNKEFNKITKIYTLGKYPFESISFIGLGDSASIDTKKMRKAFMNIALNIEEESSFDARRAVNDELDIQCIAKLFVESYAIASHKETKVNEDVKAIADVDIMSKDEDVQKSIDEALMFAKGVNSARDLSNLPSNIMTPIALADYAVKMAKKYDLECEIIDKKALVKMGAGGILGVNQGSDIEARMIVVKYNGDKGAPYTALVGKGLTFDSGGYNIKPNSLGMKYDMCGGANVLGAMEIIAGLKLKANVYCIVPTTENLINGSAFKPDDVLTSLSGKTIEILNTDAEGRLILCDAITYAQELGAKRIIDVATLTGACIVALGHEYTGGFTNSASFYNELENASKACSEALWQLPTDDIFLDALTKTTSADIKNIADVGAGASTAATFLEYFVNEGVEWIHLDIAGSGTIKAGPFAGATGAMTRSIAKLFQ